MIPYTIKDGDEAYANVLNIPNSEVYPGRWHEAAAAFRNKLVTAGRFEQAITYGPLARNTLELLLPKQRPHGLVVFVHGGYWRRFDPSLFWHLSAGPLAHGFAMAMPRYSLCPDVRVGDITGEIASAVSHAASRVDGPIHMVGHSAGGHLVTRMISHTSPLPEVVRSRIAGSLSISGIHDLRPFLQLKLNDTLQLDKQEAYAESPALLEPAGRVKLTCWVGAAERSEFVRQNALLANVWRGLGALTACVEEPDRHHFNVIEGLASPDSALTLAAIGGLAKISM